MSDVIEPWPIPPSEEFVDAVSEGGGFYADCDLCGRTCFEDYEDRYDWELGELEHLREQNRENPDKYVSLDTVRTGEIDGKSVVTNCPCNLLRRYEVWMWNHRHITAKYVAQKVEDFARMFRREKEASEEMLEAMRRHKLYLEPVTTLRAREERPGRAEKKEDAA